VIDVATLGSAQEGRVAIRELGRFDGPAVSSELMHVYTISATPRIKRQVVQSLGERADNTSLLHIVRSESDVTVRNTAIVTLGRLGNSRDQVRMLYTQA